MHICMQALHYKKYSTASDVWSFGCLMYEIWSLGHKPFEGYTNAQVYILDCGMQVECSIGTINKYLVALGLSTNILERMSI